MDSRRVGIVVLITLAAFRLLFAVRDVPHDAVSAPRVLAETFSAGRAAFSPDIRVNLTASHATEITIKIDGSYVVRPVAGQIVLGRGTQLANSKVARTARGIRIGSSTYPLTRIEIEPTNSPSIWINGHQYRGSVRLLSRTGGRLIAVNVLPLEQYLASVVDSEMPASFPEPARRAQAIVARTYALDQMQHRLRSVPFDVYATTRSQKYLGYKYRNNDGRLLAGETAAGRQVVADTSGMVCIHNNKIFRTYFSAVCGGRTTHGANVFSDAAAPLVSVPCEWCRDARLYRWRAKLSKSKVNRVMGHHFKIGKQQTGRLRTIPTAYANPGDAVATFEINNGRQKQDVTPTTFRRLFPSQLHSPRFDIRDDGDALNITGRGHGHGVGLCQWGARGLAKANRNYLQIVEYYYPGAKVVRLAQDR